MARIVKIPEAVELRPRSLKDSPQEFPKMSFKEFLMTSVESFERFGKGTKQARLQGKILDKIEAIDGEAEIHLEDEHYDAIKDSVDAFQKNPRVASILSPFLDAIENAENATLKKV